MLHNHAVRDHRCGFRLLLFGKRNHALQQPLQGFVGRIGQRRIVVVSFRCRREAADPLPGLPEQADPKASCATANCRSFSSHNSSICVSSSCWRFGVAQAQQSPPLPMPRFHLPRWSGGRQVIASDPTTQTEGTAPRSRPAVAYGYSRQRSLPCQLMGRSLYRLPTAARPGSPFRLRPAMRADRPAGGGRTAWSRPRRRPRPGSTRRGCA